MRSRWLLALPLILASGCPESSMLDAGVDAPSASDAGRDAPSALDVGEDAPRLDGGELADGGGSGAMGDCDTDADCDPGMQCIELLPGGYRVCRGTPVEATECDAGEFDDCCDSSDCKSGACYLGPIHAFCGGPVRLPSNVCASDECGADADCTDGAVCAPAGTFAPVAVCIHAVCLHDTDCTAEAGGHCVVARDACCDRAAGLLCTYDSDGCRSDSDCTSGYCGNDGTRARCTAGAAICPL